MSEPMLMSDSATTSQESASTTAADTVTTSAPATTPSLLDAADAATTQQATDGQDSAPAAKADGEKPEGEQDAAKLGAPEKYEFKPVEGVNFDNSVTEKFSEVARELNLPQEAAQKLLDKMGPAIAAQNVDAVQRASAAWADSSRADKEFGGEKLAENLSVAKKALDQFGSPELRTLLNDSGLGNHPEVLRMFYRAGRALSEDSVVPGKAPQVRTGGRDYAQTLYPNQQTH